MQRVLRQHAEVRTRIGPDDAWHDEAADDLGAFLSRGELPADATTRLFALTIGVAAGANSWGVDLATMRVDEELDGWTDEGRAQLRADVDPAGAQASPRQARVRRRRRGPGRTRAATLT